jgi:hypothetical protein
MSYTPQQGDAILLPCIGDDIKERVYVITAVSEEGADFARTTASGAVVNYSATLAAMRGWGMRRMGTAPPETSVTLPADEWLRVAGWMSAHVTPSTPQVIHNAMAAITRQVKE